ncbi:MAG TPA: hypothetical protein VHW44_33425 [Pseudonocardiaceae bacterium]|nr:hypothetical protein [Pseudonocardiaceae bacterium]
MADHSTIDHATARVDPALARETWRLAEPLHGMIYFVEEGPEHYSRLGLTGRHRGYFASRAAALGPVGAEVVQATFYNFAPDLIAKYLPAVWALAAPETLLSARLAAVDAALRRALGPAVDGPEIAEAAELAGRAARAAGAHFEGRPLFAAHAALDWPTEPHLVLWHAQTLLREFRGDGHVAALTIEGLSGIEALVSHAASGAVPAETLRVSRSWSPDQWAAAVIGLQQRGLLEPGDELVFTEAGRAQRQWIEDRTDALSVPAYSALGPDGCARLGELVRPLSRTIVALGMVPGRADRPAG